MIKSQTIYFVKYSEKAARTRAQNVKRVCIYVHKHNYTWCPPVKVRFFANVFSVTCARAMIYALGGNRWRGWWFSRIPIIDAQGFCLFVCAGGILRFARLKMTRVRVVHKLTGALNRLFPRKISSAPRREYRLSYAPVDFCSLLRASILMRFTAVGRWRYPELFSPLRLWKNSNGRPIILREQQRDEMPFRLSIIFLLIPSTCVCPAEFIHSFLYILTRSNTNFFYYFNKILFTFVFLLVKKTLNTLWSTHKKGA